jgi:hypothetical protein
MSKIELNYRRAYRWDEALWRPGVQVKVVTGENLAEIKAEYLEEIERERTHGHIIPNVSIDVHPNPLLLNKTDFTDPVAVDRASFSGEWTDVKITPHNMRAGDTPAGVSAPFQPGVVTSLDILLSLRDQGELEVVTTTFYTRIMNYYIDSYYVVGIGYPGVGMAHASGSHGFVYVTNNGVRGYLPNNAANTFHITADISVVHAPDFSRWRWIELGVPWYQDREPEHTTAVEEDLILEQYEGLNRGFVLHDPYPNPFNAEVTLPFTILDNAPVTVTVYNAAGPTVTTIVEGAPATGMHRVVWNPDNAASGVYFVVMAAGRHRQTRAVTLVK